MQAAAVAVARRPGHQHRLVVAVPAYHKIAAPQFGCDGFIEQPLYPPGNHGGARTRAAGEGFADTALEYAQTDTAAIDHFHKADIHVVGEARVALDRGPKSGDRRRFNVRDGQYGVRIAHRHGADLVGFAVD